MNSLLKKWDTILTVILTILTLILAYNTYELTQKQIDWSLRESSNINISMFNHKIISGKEIKEKICNDTGLKCILPPNTSINSLTDQEFYNVAWLGLINEGLLTLKDIDLRISCKSCNFYVIGYQYDSVIVKKANIDLPYVFLIYTERLPAIPSFQQVYWIIWKENDQNDNWYIQYSSYEKNKNDTLITIFKDGKFVGTAIP